jgi:hypothetical protein
MKFGLKLRRIGLIAATTLREALRERSFGFMLFVGLIFTTKVLFFREFNFGASELKFIADLGFGALALFGTLLAIGATVQTFFAELEGRVLHLLLARGVTPGEFVLGKIMGIQLLLGLFAAVILGCMVPLLWARESAMWADVLPTKRAFSISGILLAAGLHWLKFGILTAAVLAVCALAGSRLYALVCGFLLLLIFHAGAMLAVYATQTTGVVHWVMLGLQTLLPNFGAFDGSHAVFAGVGTRSLMETGKLVLYAAIYLAGFSFIATRLLRAREI